MSSFNSSPNGYARFAGLCYLLIIALGLTGQLVVRDALTNYDDAAQTANSLMQSETLWRLGMAGDILMQALDIPVMIILFLLFRPVSHPLALISLGFNAIQTAVLAANKLSMAGALLVLKNTAFHGAFSEQQTQASVMLFADLHDYGFAIGLVFFGFATIGYGVLIIRSGYFPSFLGYLMCIAGTCYLLNSFTLVTVPALSPWVFPILILSFLAELSFAMWLLLRGVNMERWLQAFQPTEQSP